MAKKPSQDFSDEPTPIGSTQMQTIEFRTRTANNTMTSMRDELRASIARDESEHARLNVSLADVKIAQQQTFERLEGTNARIDGVVHKLGEVSEMSAVANGKLDILIDDIKSSKQTAAHRERLTFETEEVVHRTRAQSEITDAADAKKHRRERVLKILAILGSAVGAGGGITVLIALLAGKC